jgi:hypothetical protein
MRVEVRAMPTNQNYLIRRKTSGLMRGLYLLIIITALSCCQVDSQPRLRAQPAEFYNYVPKMTLSTYYEDSKITAALSEKSCKLLKTQSILAEVGSTVIQDMRNGASSIDRAVIGNSGNSFAIDRFEWVDIEGGTQLTIQIKILNCGE